MLFAIAVSCQQHPHASKATPLPSYTILAPPLPNTAGVLKDAYHTNSLTQLQLFLQQWAREIPPVTPAELAGRSYGEQQVYALISAFYQPASIEMMGDLAGEVCRIPGKQYVMFRPDMQYTIDSGYHFTKLHNFRPSLENDSLVPVMLTPAYDCLLETFLDYWHATNEIVLPKFAFLQQGMVIRMTDDGLYSELRFTYINFNHDFTKAQIELLLMSHGERFYFERIGGKWKMIKAEFAFHV